LGESSDQQSVQQDVVALLIAPGETPLFGDLPLLLSYWSITLNILSAAILIIGLLVFFSSSIWTDGEFDSA
jgi:hypothetical protein